MLVDWQKVAALETVTVPRKTTEAEDSMEPFIAFTRVKFQAQFIRTENTSGRMTETSLQ